VRCYDQDAGAYARCQRRGPIVKKKRKLFTALAAVAIAVIALTIGLSRTGSSAADPNAEKFESWLAAKMGVSVDTLHSMESVGLSAMADRAVTENKLSTDQATKLRGVAISPLLEQAFSDLATATNSSEAELFDALANGRSLAQVADANGVDAATLKGRISQLVLSDIDAALNMGVITSAQSDSVKVLIDDAHLSQLINATIPQHENSP
jgi:hypothetical protein